MIHIPEESSKDFEWALGLNRWGAELLGVWPSKSLEYQQEGQKDHWQKRLRVPFIIAMTILSISLPQLWALSMVVENLTLVVDNMLATTASISYCFKFFFLWRSKQAMISVIELAQRDWSRPKRAWERELMLRRAFKMRLVTIVDYATAGVSLLGFLGFPLLGLNIRPINNLTDYGERHLLVQSYYPFDYSASPNYELIMGLQWIGAFFSAFAITMPENYFGALVVHVSAQLEILSLELEHFFSPDDDHDDLSPGKRPRLGELVDRHVHLNAVIGILEWSFNYVTLTQTACTSLMLCSYGFQLIQTLQVTEEQAPPLQMIAACGVMLTCAIHTFIDCIVGELLAARGVNLISSIYNCRWYALADGKRARDLIPMMILARNQKPLTAGKILPLSLATYCSVLKATAGYIAMLLTLTQK